MIEESQVAVSLLFTPKGDKLINKPMAVSLNSPNKPTKPTNQLRRELLDDYKQKQSFRVAIGLGKWVDYTSFDTDYNQREILKDEIVIEFDSTDKELVYHATVATAINLRKANITFELWDHGGKSAHIHIHNLPIAQLEDVKRATFKKLFIRKYVPKEYLSIVDISLTNIHLIALEWAEHWKGCYGVKKLIHVYDEKEII